MPSSRLVVTKLNRDLDDLLGELRLAAPAAVSPGAAKGSSQLLARIQTAARAKTAAAATSSPNQMLARSTAAGGPLLRPMSVATVAPDEARQMDVTMMASTVQSDTRATVPMPNLTVESALLAEGTTRE